MGAKLPRCKVQRCKRIARIGEWCKSHALKEADRRFSLSIRGYGGCYGVTEFWVGPEFKCAGPLQCAHLISRRYRNTRWDNTNAVPLCAAHHRYLDTHPLEKDEMMRRWLGEHYDRLRVTALQEVNGVVALEKALGVGDK